MLTFEPLHKLSMKFYCFHLISLSLCNVVRKFGLKIVFSHLFLFWQKDDWCRMIKLLQYGIRILVVHDTHTRAVYSLQNYRPLKWSNKVVKTKIVSSFLKWLHNTQYDTLTLHRR